MASFNTKIAGLKKYRDDIEEKIYDVSESAVIKRYKELTNMLFLLVSELTVDYDAKFYERICNGAEMIIQSFGDNEVSCDAVKVVVTNFFDAYNNNLIHLLNAENPKSQEYFNNILERLLSMKLTQGAREYVEQTRARYISKK